MWCGSGAASSPSPLVRRSRLRAPDGGARRAATCRQILTTTSQRHSRVRTLTRAARALRLQSLPAENPHVSGGIHLWICDFAAVNPDGTCTIVRGGAERWAAPSLPANVLAWLFVEIDGGSLPLGDHRVNTEVLNEEGVKIYGVGGSLNMLSPEHLARFVVPLTCILQSYGRYRVMIEIGDLKAERAVVASKLGA